MPPSPPGYTPRELQFFSLLVVLIPLPRERTRRHFPTPELQIDLIYVFCGVHLFENSVVISIQWQNETFSELL